MLLPHAVKADSRAVAYRNKGNVQNRKKPKDKVSSTTAHIATAYEQHPESGRLLTWIWHECPSSTARMVLSWLCNEVPYLGEACSPVELNTYEDYVLPSGVDEQLWTLSPDSALTNIRKRGKPVAYPKKGRLDDLKQAFVAANPKPKGKKNLTVSDKEDEQNFLNEYLSSQKYTINLFCCDGQNRTIQYCRNCDILRNRLEMRTVGRTYLVSKESLQRCISLNSSILLKLIVKLSGLGLPVCVDPLQTR